MRVVRVRRFVLANSTRLIDAASCALEGHRPGERNNGSSVVTNIVDRMPAASSGLAWWMIAVISAAVCFLCTTCVLALFLVHRRKKAAAEAEHTTSVNSVINSELPNDSGANRPDAANNQYMSTSAAVGGRANLYDQVFPPSAGDNSAIGSSANDVNITYGQISPATSIEYDSSAQILYGSFDNASSVGNSSAAPTPFTTQQSQNVIYDSML